MHMKASTKRNGFTLIELLVVIAIIAMLAAILFPVFARARENARKSSCQNNLKQLAMGVAQYTQDFDEAYPYGWLSVPSAHTWWQTIYPYVKSTQVYSCPSDSNKFNGGANNATSNGFPAYPTYGGLADGRMHISYAINFPVFGNGVYGSTMAFNAAEMPKPAGTVLLADSGMPAQLSPPYVTGNVSGKYSAWILVDPTCANGNPAKPCSDGGSGNSPYTPQPIGGPRDPSNAAWTGPNPRHLDTVNVAFADGHVKALRTEKWYYADSPWLNPRVGG